MQGQTYSIVHIDSPLDGKKEIKPELVSKNGFGDYVLFMKDGSRIIVPVNRVVGITEVPVSECDKANPSRLRRIFLSP